MGESEEEKILVKFCPKQVEGWMGGHPDCRDGGGGRALVSAGRVCDVYETPQGKRDTHHWVMSGRGCRREACTSVS